jgi:hypothetical protein
MFFCTLQTFGQQDYFVYLQTDNNQAFYLRINNTIYSSTTSGYLILARLPDSTAKVTIGFAKMVFPEQQFNIPVNHKDGGYILKNFGERGWGLFNLQNMAVIMNSNPAEEKKSPEITGNRKNDAFSLLLANAVNDTAVLYAVNKPKKLVPAPEPMAVVEKKKDSVATDQLMPVTPRPDSAALVKKTPERKDSTVTAKNNAKPKADSISTVTKRPPVIKTTIINKNALRDSIALAKKNPPAPDKPVTAKSTGKPAKDSLATVNNPTPAAIAGLKGKPVRKDTIIMMKGGAAEPAAPLAKNNIVKKDSRSVAAAKRDSLQLAKKQAAKKPAGKKDVAANKKTGAAVVPVAPEKDTLAIAPEPKKDTIAAIAKNNIVKKDSLPAAAARKDSLQLAKKQAGKKPAGKKDIAVNKKSETAVAPGAMKKDTLAIAPQPKKDTIAAVAKNIPAVVAEEKKDSVMYTAPVKRTRPLVYKAADLLTDTSYVAVFVDESKEVFDTIRISIPFNDAAVAKTAEPPVVAAKKIIDSLNNPVIKTPAKKDSVVVDTAAKETAAVAKPNKTGTTAPAKTTSQPKDSLPAVAQAAPNVKKDSPAVVMADSGRVLKAAPPVLFLNSDCKETALDEDIDKLRIKMLLVTTDEEKIGLAKKVFRQKCFLTKQVKALSELFKSDEGKYKWFDAVYPFVADNGNFNKLGELIKDEYYMNRFKAMLRN